MTNLETLADNLNKEDQALYSTLNFNSDSFKQFISKFTFLLSTLPPLIIVLLVYLLQWKIIYAVLIILIYQIAFYWCIETKFSYIIHLSQRAKEIILPYFKNLTSSSP